MQAEWLIHNVNIATMQPGNKPYGTIVDGLLAMANGKIAWVGPRSDAPTFETTNTIDGNGGWLTPGLIDCHTHLIYGGNRAAEFEQRQQGIPYAEISANGGGINSTVIATRNASIGELMESAQQRLACLQQEGVTTVEIKSGYGLDLETELRMLRIARALGKQLPITIKTTYLGAHAVPPEFKDRPDDYIHFVCNEVLPAVATENLADAVDLFCEEIGFTIEQCTKIIDRARQSGLPVKGHVEQLSDMGGAKMVAAANGLSVDHLEYLPASDIATLKQHNTVAVLLPAAFYYLREKQLPPIDAMRKAQLSMAVATDCNPGSAPVASLLSAMNLACVLFGLTPEEALRGTTINAAQALGIKKKGMLASGFDADLLLWQIDSPAELSYAINMHRPKQIWIAGQHV
ncbi:MAG: imidazolonepropionase [Gammaproteobacteria bacterium]|nr:imidazolonepropionase [Gammaproteobacteria bacterium]